MAFLFKKKEHIEDSNELYHKTGDTFLDKLPMGLLQIEEEISEPIYIDTLMPQGTIISEAIDVAFEEVE